MEAETKIMLVGKASELSIQFDKKVEDLKVLESIYELLGENKNIADFTKLVDISSNVNLGIFNLANEFTNLYEVRQAIILNQSISDRWADISVIFDK